MNVLHINTYDTGGAANACIRIHLSLLEQGIKSKILVLHKSRNLPEVYAFKPKRKSRLERIGKRIKLAIRSRVPLKERQTLKEKLSKVEIFSFPVSDYDITEHALYEEADIIQLNWVSGFLNEKTFFEKNKKPVIWRMADLYPGGGGNHYEKYFPFKEFESELKANYAIRKKALQGIPLIIVPISKWAEAKANESDLLKGYEKYVINNGIDPMIFRPIEKKVARDIFSLPQDKKIILFGAEYVHHRRKGLDLLMRALDEIYAPDVQVCVFGKASLNDKRIIHVDTISDDRLLTVLYSAADLFIQPSVEETFGQVIIESMAAGTPVVSFPNGGALDAVVDGVTGIIAKDFDVASMANAINKALKTDFDRHKVRGHVVQNFNTKDKGRLFIDLYSKILSNH